MTAQPDRPITIHLSSRQAEQTEFLVGLEAWLQLGLLSDEQIRQLCQEYLVCAVPQPESVSAVAASLPVAQPESAMANAAIHPAGVPASQVSDVPSVSDQLVNDPSVNDRANPRTETRLSGRVPTPSRLERWFQAFMAEISVIWLLFLGVFLVVVSSGVLAASQWQNVPPVGQYGILLSYTLAFFAAGIWTGRKENLRLTARMLQITTVLIIPINFWMIDELGLWRSFMGGMVALSAGLILTVLTIRLFRSPLSLISRRSLKLITLNYLALSWLHWGWGFSSFPLVATYIGTVSTTVLIAIQTSIAPAAALLAAATLLLIGRAILLSQVPIAQLGLALGLCGWVFCWVRRPTPSMDAVGTRRDQSLWTFAGVGLLGLGWLVSVGETLPLQAFAVSGLGLWLLVDRLQQTQRSSTLTALLLVGLQTYVLLWRILPDNVQSAIITIAENLVGEAAMPFVLLGLAFFPYLWLCLHFTPLSLMRQTEWFALVLGGVMTLISLLNPGVRSLNLLLSALTLGWVSRRGSIVAPVLVYLTHAMALATVLSGMDWGLPDLSQIAWARTLLVLMAIEWLLCLTLEASWWRRSAWHLGLGLAGLSYSLLLPTYVGVVSATESQQNLVWLGVPLLLTGLSRLQQFFAPFRAAWFSIGALGLHLFLIGTLDSWMISLTIAVGVMVVNADTLRHLLAVILTVGFALALEATLIWRFGSEQLTDAWIGVVTALTLWVLWFIWSWLIRHPAPLRTLYGKAIDGWATGLFIWLLLYMPLLGIAVSFSQQELPIPILLGSVLTVGAVTYRLWQQPTEPGFYGLGGAIEALLILLVIQMEGAVTDWAMGNLGAGLLTQLTAEIWVHRSGQSYRRSWHLIPLFYAVLGVLAAHTTFTALTGLYTLAAALVGIGIGRRQAKFRVLTFLSLLAGSIAAYELLLYQLILVEGGRPGDGLVLLAGLAALISWLYRLLSRWLLPYLRFTPSQLYPIAHFHWAVGSLFALLALITSLSPSSTGLLFGIATGLTVYALSLGRSPHVSIRWTYVGIVEALFTLAYGLYEASPDRSLLIEWAGAIASGTAMGMYSLPWRRWGWSERPWQNAATVLPIVVVGLTSFGIAIQSLLMTAAFYAWYAKESGRIRFSYLGVGLLNWAVLRIGYEQGWLNLLWFSVMIGASILYVAQIDPALQTQTAREQRHFLRSIATALVCFTALYQAEVEVGRTAILIGMITLALSVGLVFSGLLLRVRAYLYIGTVTFMLRILRWLWLFISHYSLLLWAVGIVLGLVFIWIAATFEARRSQVNAIVQYWSAELEQWE